MGRYEEGSWKGSSGEALGQQLSIPSKVFMLLRSTLVMESSLMSPVKTNLPQLFKFFSLMLESHATIWGVISPVRLWNKDGESGWRGVMRSWGLITLHRVVYFKPHPFWPTHL